VISAATATRVGQQLAARLGVVPSLEAIAAVPMDRLLQAQAALHADLDAQPAPERWGHEVAVSLMPWQPVIDGDVLPARPIDRIAAGAGAGVDVLVGTNTDEHRIFLVTSGAIDQVTPEALAGLVSTYGLSVQPTLAAYRAAHPGGETGDLFAAIQTDWYWRIPALRLADAHATTASTTYMYEFAWRSPQFAGRFGACHALEIPFVFDTLGNGTETLWGTTPPQRLADIMHEAWVAFATNGDPGWPRYDQRSRSTMCFDLVSEVVDDPRSGERELWKGLR
jgi:carboxylesterase type B